MSRPQRRACSATRPYLQCTLPTLTAALLAACSLAPPYHRPTTPPVPSTYEEARGWTRATPAEILSKGPWWRLFNDPQLNALEDRLLGINPNVRAAMARLDAARAQVGIARSQLFPTVNLDLAPSRARQSLNAPNYDPNERVVYNEFTLEPQLSYEIDAWGRIRNNVAAARANANASAADLATLELSLRAELAIDYFTLRSEDAQEIIFTQTVASYQQALQLTQNLYDGGAAPISDLQQAQAQLDTALTQATDVRLRRAQTEHAIAVLLGSPPATFQLPPQPLAATASAPTLEPGMPSTLLERRPDVAAAERRVRAANANIGVARAAYFPVFDLFGGVGFESASLSNLISAPSWLWSVGSSALVPLIDGGLHRAQSAQAQAQYNEQVANYRSIVLSAYQDVEDQLAALRELQRESASQALAVQAAGGALQQAQYQYMAGVVTYLQIVASQTTYLNAQQAALDIETRRFAASIGLIKAMGGGWHAE